MKTVEDLKQFRKHIITSSDATVEAGKTKTGKIGTNKTLHGIMFLCTGSGTGLTRSQMIADIAKLSIKAEGVVIRELTTTQILDLYKHYNDDRGAYTIEGVLPIEFTRGAFDFSQLNNSEAIGMMRNGKPMNLTYEITYAATVTTLDKVEVRAYIDDRIQEFGRHTRIVPHTRSHDSTGNQDITTLPAGSPCQLLAYHIVLGSGVISKVSVTGDDKVYDQLQRQVLEFMLNNAGRKVQSGYFHLPFDLDNDPRSYQQLGAHLAEWLVQFNWTTSPGGSFTIIQESVHNGLK